MASSGSTQTSTTDLEVSLESGSAPSTIEVIISNHDSAKTITFLTWDTPVDPQAINNGILDIKDVGSGHTIPSPGLLVNRMRPPPRDDLVELKPGSSTRKNVALSSPWIPTDGKKYQIQMQGSWRAIWMKAAAQVTDDELAAMTGDQDDTSFDSGILEMELRQ